MLLLSPLASLTLGEDVIVSLRSLRETQFPNEKTANVHWQVSKTPPLASDLKGKPLDIQVKRKLSDTGFEERTLSSVVAFTLLHHLEMSEMKLFIVYTKRSQVNWTVQGFGNGIQSFLLWACWISPRPGFC